MLIFASSDKGGTGRSVTACNLAYRLSRQGQDVAYLDFDFGSPTVGAIFEASRIARGTPGGDGLHSYLDGSVTDPVQVDVRTVTERPGLRRLQSTAGRLVLLPGDEGGAEFGPGRAGAVNRLCVQLFLQLLGEFDVVIVDLSAGRSQALDMVLRATAEPQLGSVWTRWLIFYRWTRQHILAAHGLVYGARGLLDIGTAAGHERDRLQDAVRFVRTAVPSLNQPNSAHGPAQASWLRTYNDELRKLALELKLGQSVTLGETPIEPMLQWREQIISDNDVAKKIANEETVAAFLSLATAIWSEAVEAREAVR